MFSAHEILDIAISIEEEGIDFYTVLSSDSDRPDAASAFRYLAEQERQHAETFSELLARFKEEEQELFNWSDASDYIRSFSRNKVFPKAADVLGNLSAAPVSKAIDFAIDVEKETVIFYYEVLEILNDEDARAAVKKIIEEEKKHIVVLRKLLDK